MKKLENNEQPSSKDILSNFDAQISFSDSDSLNEEGKYEDDNKPAKRLDYIYSNSIKKEKDATFN